ncbi:hypothetical protein PQE75_gp056 [Bacillus phage vB_BcoS-136]|uniref:Uncharacterized protein n=1 Tax=Bacillus phage vB_BcoS-136 TaxID=2419619 RepID=A0A3G3BVC6_9CAUD|nr:hypothetical protein PQE75_gp056 [Bacillus phage vB_BcoS-136]AYP68188.1 hypothetical protein vBBcoS136_00056 [Bacillus phage vB_BcoS-136]
MMFSMIMFCSLMFFGATGLFLAEKSRKVSDFLEKVINIISK